MQTLKGNSKSVTSKHRQGASSVTTAELNVLKIIGYKELGSEQKSEIIKRRLNEAWETSKNK